MNSWRAEKPFQRKKMMPPRLISKTYSIKLYLRVTFREGQDLDLGNLQLIDKNLRNKLETQGKLGEFMGYQCSKNLVKLLQNFKRQFLSKTFTTLKNQISTKHRQQWTNFTVAKKLVTKCFKSKFESTKWK